MIAAPNSRGSAHLDLARGVAALVVFGNHARNLFLVDYGDVAHKNPAVQAFYFVTSLGHEAVMVFFVLSGFFITSSVVRQFDRWSWTAYLIDRLSRLHIVLVPALLATAAWDALGMRTGVNTEIYQGTADNVLIRTPVADRSDGYHFVVSFLYLQTILAPPFGSNSPLWSLANEFWYYILFPAALLAVRGRSWTARCGHAVLACAVGWLVGWPVLMLFPVWLFGSGLVAVGPVRALPARAVRIAGWLAAAAVLAALMAISARLYSGRLPPDYLLGAVFTLWVYLTAHDDRPVGETRGWRLYHRFAGWLAGFSYTLYLVHVPLLVFLRSHLIPGLRWQPSAASLGVLAAISIAVLLYAWGFSLMTEKQTVRVRNWCRRQVGLGGRQATKPEAVG